MKHKTLTQAEPIVRLKKRLAYENRFVAVYDDDVRFTDGHTGSYLRIVQSGGLPGVVMLPVADGHAGLVHVFRYPTGTWEWGLPRGLAHGGDPEATARTELLEELGAQPSSLVSLGAMTPDSGLLTAVVHLFWASYPAPVSATRDRGEVAGVQWLPLPDLLAEIASSRIRDGYTLAAVCRALCQGLLS